MEVMALVYGLGLVPAASVAAVAAIKKTEFSASELVAAAILWPLSLFVITLIGLQRLINRAQDYDA